jgi:hypothetical protein
LSGRQGWKADICLILSSSGPLLSVEKIRI